MEARGDPVLRLLTIIIVLDFFSLGQPRRIALLVGIKSAPPLQNYQDVLCYALMGIVTKKLQSEQPFQEL